MDFAYIFRVFISALLVGCVTTGNAIQVVLQDGKAPSKWQLYSALLGGVLLFLNDVKSRLSPTNGRG